MKNITKHNSELPTIGDFLSKKIIKENLQINSYSIINIPLYQRDYSWNIDSINNFLEVFDNFDSLKFRAKPIYFGNIFYYININNNNTIDIVDGQQRITTIHILLFAIRNIIKSDNKFKEIESNINNMLFTKKNKLRINHMNKRERNSFSKMVEYSEKEQNTDNIPKNSSIFLKNYGIIHKWLRNNSVLKLNFEKNIIDIIDNLIKVGLFCLDDVEEAIATFATINSRGQNLTILDLLKSEIFSMAEKDDKEAEFDDEWQIFLSVLNCEGSIYKNDYDKFLQHFLFSRFEHTKKTELKFKKNKWMENKKDGIEIIKDMTKYMNSFLELFKSNDILNCEVNLLGFHQHIPIAINIYENFPNDNPKLIIQKIHELLISIVSINNEQANVLESIMVELSKTAKQAKKISDIKQKINEYIWDALGEYKDNRRGFINRLVGIDFKKTNYIKFFFSKTSMKNEEKINWKTSTLEHICPTNFTKWKQESPEKNFNSMIYKIGNGTILENRLNTAISNETFTKKKNIINTTYSNESDSSIKNKKTNYIFHSIIEKDFFKNENFLDQTNWTKEIVDNRTKIICESLFNNDFMKEL